MMNNKWKTVCFSLLTAFLLGGCEKPREIPVPESAKAPCSDQTFAGFPKQEPPMGNTYFVCHQGFALQYSARLHAPLWVAQNLKGVNLDEKKVTRDNEKFRPDGFLPEGLTPDTSRFSNTGYDRGHMAPAGDFTENPAAMSRSFYTSNIVPQNPDNNRGIWVRLEKNVRGWAKQKGEVYVVTGPIFYNNKPYKPRNWISLTNKKENYVIDEYNDDDLVDPQTGLKNKELKKLAAQNGIAIPTHLYKIVYDPRAKQGIAFVVPNKSLPPQSLAQYATTIAEVEKLTYIRFFPQLPLEEQAKLKTQVDARQWLLGI